MNKQKKVKILFLLVDGIADLGIKELNQQTPLQFANLDIFNALSASGLNGIMDPVETGLACGSDTAHLNILGYNPFQVYNGRGSFETMGSGLSMEGDEIAFKCNFAYMNPDSKIVEKRRVDRNFEKWGLSLIDAIDNIKIPGFEDYYIRAMHATEHRCGIKVSGPQKHQLTSKITGTDPLKDNLKLRRVFPLTNDTQSNFTANLVNNLSDEIHRILQEHPLNKERIQNGLLPGNIVLLRGCGQKLSVPNFKEKHGFTGFMIAPTAIINGLGQSLGIYAPNIEGATGDYNSNFNKKMDAAINLFNDANQNFDFGFVHIKAVDDAGHDKSYEKKIKYIKKSEDALLHFVQQVEKLKIDEENEFIILVTGDHTTPIKQGDHTFEPVPLAVSTYSALCHKLKIKACQNDKLLSLADKVQKYDELSCGQGVLGRFTGCDIIKILKNLKKTIESIV